MPNVWQNSDLYPLKWIVKFVEQSLKYGRLIRFCYLKRYVTEFLIELCFKNIYRYFPHLMFFSVKEGEVTVCLSIQKDGIMNKELKDCVTSLSLNCKSFNCERMKKLNINCKRVPCLARSTRRGVLSVKPGCQNRECQFYQIR